MAHNRPSRRVGVSTSIAIAALVLSGCSSTFFKVTPDGAPQPATVPPAAPAPTKPAPKPSTPAPSTPAPTTPPAAIPAPKPASAKPTAALPASAVNASGVPAAPDTGKPTTRTGVRTPTRVATREPVNVAPTIDTTRIGAAPTSEPEPIASDSIGVHRLMTLANVWLTVSLHHPYVAGRAIAWDSATIRAIPKVHAARTQSQWIAAVEELLSVLNDPVTRIQIDTAPKTATLNTPARAEFSADGVLTLQITDDASLGSADSTIVAQALARNPQRVIIDLRTNSTSTSAPRDAARARSFNAFLEKIAVAPLLTSVPLIAPTERVRRVGGAASANPYRPFGEGSDVWVQRDASVIAPNSVAEHKVVIVANRASVLPRALMALVSAGRATLVAEMLPSEKWIDDGSLVSLGRTYIADHTIAQLRMGELIHADGTTGLLADTIVPLAPGAGDNAPAIRAALQIVRSARAPRAKRPAISTVPMAVVPVAMDNQNYPTMGARVLAGFRLWGAMRTRHANRDLYDEELETVFARVLPKLESARNEQQYAAAIGDLASALDDAASTMTGPSFETWLGTSTAPIRLRFIEGRAIITDVVHDSATTALGLTVGTEITAADGFPIPAWMNEHRRSGAASNEWTRNREQMRVVPLGPEGAALFKVRDANGKERTINMPRRASYSAILRRTQRPDAAPIRKLDANVVYIDLERVNARAVDSTLGAITGTRALVLDLRSAAVDTTVANMLVATLATQPDFVRLREVERYATTPCLNWTLRQAASHCADERAQHVTWTHGDTANHYRGRVLLLIDERTQGAAERLAAALESAVNVTFAGSASAGAPSVAIPLELPGALSVGIPVVEVRRPDGGQLQRVGITPSIDVRPTVRGVRNGQDEVIERAQQWIGQQIDPTQRAPIRRKR